MDNQLGKHLSINGVDISAEVRAIDLGEMRLPDLDASLPVGLKRMGPVSFTIDFDDRERCCSCGQRFVAGPEGVPVLKVGGRVIGSVCVECGVALEGMSAPSD